MEVLGLTLVIVVLAAYYGVFRSVETGARMAERRMERFEAEQIKDDIVYYEENKVAADKYKKAVEAKTQFKSFRGL